ncbi:hypothetical protein [Chroococcidiopsis sp. SAG 2025]|nr:hypothetical protein [Chroococcidiopsis sp. SAG 2025]
MLPPLRSAREGDRTPDWKYFQSDKRGNSVLSTRPLDILICLVGNISYIK